jgi:glucoamylase
MVWCRDGTESALALAAAGHTDDAAALLAYLASRQQPEGCWPRCFFVDGEALPGAVQLDETAFPVVLAGRLAQDGVTLPVGSDQMIGRAAGYLARNGPITGVDRWEENPGGSAFTIGLEIVALLVAANYLTDPDRQLALQLADNWNERLEEFTYVVGSEVDQFFGTAGHYVRIGPAPESIKTTIGLQNQPANVAEIASEALIGLEFLYLPRLGLREPMDQRILDTLVVVDRLIRKNTPSGRAAYNRYNVDGYGEWLDGSGWPRRKIGIGRPWPILSGEFGHYAVLRGDGADEQMAAMLEMRGKGGLLPEQIWDANPLPWRSLQPGKPAGSAMPLAWAHSELIKLAITATHGQPVEQLQIVLDRWSRQAPPSDPWLWLDSAHVTRLPVGRTLMVTDRQPFRLHYGFDDPSNWHDVSDRPAGPLGLGLFGAAVGPADQAGHTSLWFVRQRADGTWESSNHGVTLGVPHPPALRPPLRERNRVVARGGGQ